VNLTGVGKAPTDKRIDRLAINVIWSLSVPVGSIVYGQTGEGRSQQQLIAVEHRLEGIVYRTGPRKPEMAFRYEPQSPLTKII
jgi:hypothetical protein